MRICFYMNELGGGGAERVMTNLANYFSNFENDVILLSSYYTNYDYEVQKTVRRMALEDKRSEGNGFVRNIKWITKLRSIIKREKPDVIVSFMAEPNFRNIISTLGLPVKTIVSVRNDPKKEYSGVKSILAKILFRKADWIVFQTQAAQSFFSKSIQKKSAVIMNPVKDIFFNSEASQHRNGIIACGRLTPQKNHRLLIEAFASVCEHFDDNLYIFGDGSLRDELISLADELKVSNRVFINNYSPNIIDEMKTKKMYVMSSNYEGMPNSLMEALALGIPSISTDCPCGGPKALIQNNVNGILIPCGDSKKMGEAILKIETDISFQQNVGMNARRMASIFTTENIANQWMEIFRLLCQQK